MDPITLRLPSDTLEDVDNEADEQGLSRAEYLREIVENRHVDKEIRSEYEAKLSDYEQSLNKLETEVERLRNEKRTLINDRQEKQELVEYIEEERSLSKQKAQAGAFTRAKWWAFGMPDDD